MQIITKKLSQLKPAEYNPRSISDEALRGLQSSIEEFGCVELIVWNKRTGKVE
jgi:ParB-like chromosome segregation protein Spo0J